MKKAALTGILFVLTTVSVFAGPDLRGLSFGVGPGFYIGSRPVFTNDGEAFYSDIYTNMTFDVKFNRIMRNGFTFINDLSYGFALAGREKWGYTGGSSTKRKYKLSDFKYNAILNYTFAVGFSPLNKKHIYLSLTGGPSISWIGMKSKGSLPLNKTPDDEFVSHILIGLAFIGDLGYFVTKMIYINIGLRINWDFWLIDKPDNEILDLVGSYGQLTIIPTFGIGIHFR